MRHKAVVLLLFTAISLPAPAATRGTPAEARAMLAKAVERYRAAGRTQAFADFNAGKAPFKDRDLYVFCIGMDGITHANGGFPRYVGTSVNLITDAEGHPLGQRLIESVKGKEHGEVHYHWINPVTHKAEPKTAFTVKLGDDVCGVGAYSPD